MNLYNTIKQLPINIAILIEDTGDCRYIDREYSQNQSKTYTKDEINELESIYIGIIDEFNVNGSSNVRTNTKSLLLKNETLIVIMDELYNHICVIEKYIAIGGENADILIAELESKFKLLKLFYCTDISKLKKTVKNRINQYKTSIQDINAENKKEEKQSKNDDSGISDAIISSEIVLEMNIDRNCSLYELSIYIKKAQQKIKELERLNSKNK